jgi:putative permease
MSRRELGRPIEPTAEAAPAAGFDLFGVLVRALVLAAALVVVLFLLSRIEAPLMVFALAVILAAAMNAPVRYLERERGFRRGIATLLVFVVFAAITGFLGWLIVPRLIEEIPTFFGQAEQIVEQLTALLGGHPQVEQQLNLIGEWLMGVVGNAWRFTDSIIAGFLLTLFLIAIVLFMVANPRPLLKFYLVAMPPRFRAPAARAFARFSRMVVRWFLANALLGGMKAVAVFAFLTYMEIPGALLWSLLALFAALIPRIGFYIMATPPVLVAFATDPLNAIWVLLYLWLLSEFLGNFVAPRIYGDVMHLHPAYLLLMTLVTAYAFGLLGVLIAVPAAGFLKVYLDEFYLADQPEDPDLERRVDAMLEGEPEPG